jgi:hypothetical protein
MLPVYVVPFVLLAGGGILGLVVWMSRQEEEMIPPIVVPIVGVAVAGTLLLVVVMQLSVTAGVAAALVLVSVGIVAAVVGFFARPALQEGTFAWREETSRHLGVQRSLVAVGLLFLAGGVAVMVWAFQAQPVLAAVTLGACLGGVALFARRSPEWKGETERAYHNVEGWSKLAVGIAWLTLIGLAAASMIDSDDLAAGRFWEPALLGLLAIVPPVVWLLWERGFLSAREPHA